MKHEINFPDHSGEEYEKHLLAKQKAKEKESENLEIRSWHNLLISIGFVIVLGIVIASATFFDSEVAFFTSLVLVAIGAFVIFKKVK